MKLVNLNPSKPASNRNDSWHPGLQLQTKFRSPRPSLSGFEMLSVERKREKRGDKTLTIDDKIAILDQLGTLSYVLLCESYRIS